MLKLDQYSPLYASAYNELNCRVSVLELLPFFVFSDPGWGFLFDYSTNSL